MKKIIVLLLALILCGGILAGCAKEDDVKTETEDTTVVLADFESKEELLSMNFRDTVAKVELSDRPETVTRGNYSGKITLHGVYDYKNQNYQDSRFYIVTGGKYCTKTGYLDAAAIALDVFNGSDREILFTVCLNNPSAATSMYQFESVSLKPGMNNLRWEFNRERISYGLDLQRVDFFTFLVHGRELEEQPAELYFDNFRVETTETAFTEPAKQPTDTILTDFSQEADFNYYSYFGAVSSLLTQPVFSKNTDLHYILTGNASMKIEFFENRSGTGADGIGFRTKDREFNWNGFDQAKTMLSYDMFNATDHELTVCMTVYSKLNETYAVNCVIPAQSWAAAGNTILLSALNDRFIGNGLDIFSITFQLIGLQAGDVVYLDNLVLKEA